MRDLKLSVYIYIYVGLKVKLNRFQWILKLFIYEFVKIQTIGKNDSISESFSFDTKAPLYHLVVEGR